MKRTRIPKGKISYKRTTKPVKWNEDRIRQAFLLASMFGATDVQIAEVMNVNEHTINYWKRTKPEFLAALQEGKLEPDQQVEKCMFQRACGYSHLDTDIKVVNGRIVETEITKHYPPDVTAGIFWLKNRMREKWADVNKPIAGDVNITQINLTGFTREEKLALEKMGIQQLMENTSTQDDN